MPIMMLFEHMLAFPFWARCCIGSSVVSSVIYSSNTMRPALSPLGPTLVCQLVLLAALVGEMVGHLLQHAVRIAYLARLQEHERLQSRIDELVHERDMMLAHTAHHRKQGYRSAGHVANAV